MGPAPARLSGSWSGGFASRTPLRAWTRSSDRARAYPPASPPRVLVADRWSRTINLVAIAYAFRPRLRDRLTLGGLTFPRNPKTSGVPVFHRDSRYSGRHNPFGPLHRSFRSGFTGGRMLPYHAARMGGIRSFGTRLEPRYIVGATALDQ